MGPVSIESSFLILLIYFLLIFLLHGTIKNQVATAIKFCRPSTSTPKRLVEGAQDLLSWIISLYTAQKIKFPIKDFYSKCDQTVVWSHLLKKSLLENFMFCAVLTADQSCSGWDWWCNKRSRKICPSVFEVFLVRIFQHWDWILSRNTPNTDNFYAVVPAISKILQIHIL